MELIPDKKLRKELPRYNLPTREYIVKEITQSSYTLPTMENIFAHFYL